MRMAASGIIEHNYSNRPCPQDTMYQEKEAHSSNNCTKPQQAAERLGEHGTGARTPSTGDPGKLHGAPSSLIHSPGNHSPVAILGSWVAQGHPTRGAHCALSSEKETVTDSVDMASGVCGNPRKTPGPAQGPGRLPGGHGTSAGLVGVRGATRCTEQVFGAAETAGDGPEPPKVRALLAQCAAPPRAPAGRPGGPRAGVGRPLAASPRAAWTGTRGSAGSAGSAGSVASAGNTGLSPSAADVTQVLLASEERE